MPARILVVDDDPLTAELICEILLSASMDASFLTSSSEAAERLYPGTYRSYGSCKTKNNVRECSANGYCIRNFWV